VLLDRVPVRLERAQKIGIRTMNVDDSDILDQIKAWANGSGPHAVIVTASNLKAVQLGFDAAGPGATLMLYAPPAPGNDWALNINRMFFQEMVITGSYSASPHDTRRTLSLLANKVIDPNVLITHRFPLAEAEKAWHLTKAAGDSLKVMVNFV
jgi:L-iditol 2-dehydrogenase